MQAKVGKEQYFSVYAYRLLCWVYRA